MVAKPTTRSAEIRAQVKHPIIDSDGHLLELTPVFLDYLKQIGGGDLVKSVMGSFGPSRSPQRPGYASWGQAYQWQQMSLEERRDSGTAVMPWWIMPTKNTLDRATAYLPRLLSQRLEEMGMDFTVLFPTSGAGMPSIPDEELRRASCRALNTYLAELYGPYAQQMTPAAAIPMHTPQEAIEELEHAVKVLGLKAIMIAGYVARPVAKAQRDNPNSPWNPMQLDSFGIDSPYDYDPFWAKCVELGVAPATHSGGMGLGFRSSASNYMYNHLGHFASVGEALCKSLFMGGVTHRFPALRVAFLECGVAWGCSLYAEMIGHWEKRNATAIHNMDPAFLDRDGLVDLIAQYGDRPVTGKLEEIKEALGQKTSTPANVDEWSLVPIQRAQDIYDFYVPHFFFGCEADDPMNAWAFNSKVNPFGARLGALLSSDIGHWDVPDMRTVVEEAYELVEEGLMTEEDFHDFAFANSVRFFGGMNPEFFKGTVVERDVEKFLIDPASRQR